MKLVHSKVEYLPQEYGLEGVYRQIERCARTCYKSEDKITSTSAKEFVDRMISSNHCYTGNSMVLTENGWIHWSNYNGEKVAVIDHNGDFVRFEIPERVVKHSYTGNFYYYPLLGLEVTDGHRMYGLFRESKNNFYNSTLYDVFVCGHPYKDNNGRQKTLGERMFKVPKHCNVPTYTNPFYELIGFWLVDGCYQPQTVNKLVFHLKKERKVKYLQSLCEELGYTFEVGKGNHYRVCSPQIGAKFNQLFYQNGKKYIPNMYMAEDAIAVKSIILGLVNSGGSKGVNTKTITFTSTSWSIIQWLDNVAPIGGFTTSFRGICHETPVHNPVYKIFLLDTDYTINNDSRNPDSKVRIINKTEDVYCVTVSTGLILVRGDNGVTSICGNCAMLEHGTVYLYLEVNSDNALKQFEYPLAQFTAHYNWSNVVGNIAARYNDNQYSRVTRINTVEGVHKVFITTNLRVVIENSWEDDLQFISKPIGLHMKRYTIRFTTDRGISHELVRHRNFSFAQESTRYCNYSKGKFGNELTFIIPSWMNIKEGNVTTDSFGCPVEADAETYDFLSGLGSSERCYFRLINKGWKPQQARQVLPNALKTEICMTGYTCDWMNFLKLRKYGTTGKPHPDMESLATKVEDIVFSED